MKTFLISTRLHVSIADYDLGYVALEAGNIRNIILTALVVSAAVVLFVIAR
jgi:hypothetical protein